MVKRLHMGRAAEAGVVAALLAHDGYEGPDSVLEGKYGYLEAYARDGDATQFTKGKRSMNSSQSVCQSAG